MSVNSFEKLDICDSRNRFFQHKVIDVCSAALASKALKMIQL